MTETEPVFIESKSAKAEKAANRLGDHLFFVRANDADGGPAGRRGNHALIPRVLLFFEFDSKKSQSIANARSNNRAVFADTTGKNQRIQSAK